uniref:Methyltransferase n=1 Tax=viral metagenome TaxID=1070528 RepID=A0A6M3JYW7_9ZZZZ
MTKNNFKRSSRCPPLQELNWLDTWCARHRRPNLRVLEIGCGITSCIMQESLQPDVHVAIEQYPDCIKETQRNCPKVTIVPTWDLVPKYNYNIFFVDSSTGWPKDIIPMTAKRPFRDDAIKYLLPLCSKDVIIILHDYEHKQIGWRAGRTWLENNGFVCIEKYTYRFGFGVMVKEKI